MPRERAEGRSRRARPRAAAGCRRVERAHASSRRPPGRRSGTGPAARGPSRSRRRAGCRRAPRADGERHPLRLREPRRRRAAGARRHRARTCRRRRRPPRRRAPRCELRVRSAGCVAASASSSGTQRRPRARASRTRRAAPGAPSRSTARARRDAPLAERRAPASGSSDEQREQPAHGVRNSSEPTIRTRSRAARRPRPRCRGPGRRRTAFEPGRVPTGASARRTSSRSNFAAVSDGIERAPPR